MQGFVLELSRIMLLHWRQLILGLQSAMHNGRVHCLKQDDLLSSEGWSYIKPPRAHNSPVHVLDVLVISNTLQPTSALVMICIKALPYSV